MAKKIIIGVSGGIAAYKAAMLTSRLVQSGYDIQVVMTLSATAFIGEPTFTALTGKPVVKDMFDERFPLGPHIELAREFDVFCVAPATANQIGHFANGIANDLLSTLYLCFTGPVLVAPAMNCEMWESKSVVRNVEQIKKDGVRIIGPEEGWLSCRVKGQGRMSNPDTIFEAIEHQFQLND